MSNKTRYISAFRETVKKYRRPLDKYFFNTRYCSMCRALGRPSEYEDSPCPMVEHYKDGGNLCCCHKFRTFKVAQRFISNYDIDSPVTEDMLTPKLIAAFNKRADSLEKIISIIEKWPDEWFTVKGCKNAPHIPWNL